MSDYGKVITLRSIVAFKKKKRNCIREKIAKISKKRNRN
jgi:hypothetical protein